MVGNREKADVLLQAELGNLLRGSGAIGVPGMNMKVTKHEDSPFKDIAVKDIV